MKNLTEGKEDLESRMWDVVVVGAGPSGCEVARAVSERGYKVLVLEEHSEVGVPTQCAGLVSFRIGKIPKKLILNKVKTARFCCKSATFDIRSKKPMYVIDRRNYDLFLAERARKAGAKFRLRARFSDFKDRKIFTSDGSYLTKLLVGADGPNSSVARAVGIELPPTLLRAVQIRVRSSFDANMVELWFGSDIAPGNFAWVVPENEELARVGLMAESNPNLYFERFLKRRFGKFEGMDKIVDVIRCGLIKKSVAERVLLVGDAACQVKPFSLGGLVYGRIGAKIAANACTQALEENNFSESFLLEKYDVIWKRKLRLPIIKGISLKKLFSVFQDSPAFFRILDSFLSNLVSLLDVDFY